MGFYTVYAPSLSYFELVKTHISLMSVLNYSRGVISLD